jgi:hypothetical protein
MITAVLIGYVFEGAVHPGQGGGHVRVARLDLGGRHRVLGPPVVPPQRGHSCLTRPLPRVLSPVGADARARGVAQGIVGVAVIVADYEQPQQERGENAGAVLASSAAEGQRLAFGISEHGQGLADADTVGRGGRESGQGVGAIA